MATYNPFRSAASAPSNQASSSSTYASPAGPPPPVPPKPAPPGISGTDRDVPESDSDSSRSPSPAGPRLARSSPQLPTQAELQEVLRAETPPPYTPTADFRHGETTVEMGPRRPFAQAPTLSAPLVPPWQRPQRTGLLNAAFTGYPGSLQRQSTGVTVHNRPVPPPPQHPALPRRPVPTTVHPVSAPAPASDFARDFYAAGVDDRGIMGGMSSQYAPPPTAPAASQYAPPPGPPPGLPPRPSPGNSSGGEFPDDGRPTSKPVPGHPLMNSGKVLVYPTGYECPKCHNTGYKHLDPSNPCSKCWSKYAKAFAGPLTYAPWDSSSSSTNFQRPLPSLSRGPTTSYAHRSSASLGSLPPPPQHASLTRSASSSRTSGYPGASSPGSPSGIPLANGGFLPTAPYLSPLHHTGESMSPLGGAPAQYNGATVVRPGDPRIGGRLCWRCGGKGTTSFLIFDVETCGVCNGVGRTFS